jgi:hypothetical protein
MIQTGVFKNSSFLGHLKLVFGRLKTLPLSHWWNPLPIYFYSLQIRSVSLMCLVTAYIGLVCYRSALNLIRHQIIIKILLSIIYQSLNRVIYSRFKIQGSTIYQSLNRAVCSRFIERSKLYCHNLHSLWARN